MNSFNLKLTMRFTCNKLKSINSKCTLNIFIAIPDYRLKKRPIILLWENDLNASKSLLKKRHKAQLLVCVILANYFQISGDDYLPSTQMYLRLDFTAIKQQFKCIVEFLSSNFTWTVKRCYWNFGISCYLISFIQVYFICLGTFLKLC